MGYIVVIFHLQTFHELPEKSKYSNLEPQTTIYKWMFGETTFFYIKIWNHPIETSIYKWLFGAPGMYPRLCNYVVQFAILYFIAKATRANLCSKLLKKPTH